MSHHLLLSLIVSLIGFSWSLTAQADLCNPAWPYPEEISLAETYNRLYQSDYPSCSYQAMQLLLEERAAEMRSVWSLEELAEIQVLVFDTAGTQALQLKILDPQGALFVPLYDPGPWTPDSRGWLPDQGSDLLDIEALLEAWGYGPDTLFSFSIGERVLNSDNAYLLSGEEPGELIIAYNDGSLQGGDRDANEPIFLGLPPIYCEAESCDGVDNDCDGEVDEGCSCPAQTIILLSDEETLANGEAAVPTYDGNARWTADIEGATWIWDVEFEAAPGVNRWVLFERRFQLPEDATLLSGHLEVAADNSYECSLNGQGGFHSTSEFNYFQEFVQLFDLEGLLIPGENILRCEVMNWAQPGGSAYSNPAGILFRLEANTSASAFSEICDGVDNDCDGEIDEGLLNACGECGSLPAEICDGVDNDCDGEIDEGFNLGSRCELERCGGVAPLCVQVGAWACAPDGSVVCSEMERCYEPLLWQLGSFEYGLRPREGAAEFPAEDQHFERFNYRVVGQGDPNPQMPGYLSQQPMRFIDPHRALSNSTPELSISFLLNRELEGGELEWSRYGSETNALYLDGELLGSNAIAEGVNSLYHVQLPTLAAGEHELLIQYQAGGAQNGNYLDALRLYVRRCEPLGPELCGNGMDDDCDCELDEGFEGLGGFCAEGEGICSSEGLMICSSDALNLECGAPEILPMEEICDSLDNDCDGFIDEELLNACDQCGPTPEEICDGEDNDCDGEIDEGLLNLCGACGPAPEEICDGLDNDCDGFTDEGLLNACGNCGLLPEEICYDAEDNDCDGFIDEGCFCHSQVRIFSDEETQANGAAAVPTYDGNARWTAEIEEAIWIWDMEFEAEPEIDRKVYFERRFLLPEEALSFDGVLEIAADNSYACSLNGHGDLRSDLGLNYFEEYLQRFVLDSLLISGENILRCEVLNWAQPGGSAYTNPGGLLFRLEAEARSPILPEACDGFDNDCDGEVDEGPFGPEICEDGLDNNCNGLVDEGCPESCDSDWPFPCEISVAEAWNRSFTGQYSGQDYAALMDLVEDHGGEMQGIWDIYSLERLQVLVFDTSGVNALFMVVGDVRIELHDPGPWTPTSRGWQPDQGAQILETAQILEEAGFDPETPFSLAVGRRSMNASNTWFLDGDGGSFLLAYNDGGLQNGDRDANEPIILGFTAACLPEVCDGEDNDCDGLIDEELLNACGACGPVPEEICDGEDNNCDGAIDEGLLNVCGACGAVPEEICDGEDNDCDGATDEGLLNACGACGAVPEEICGDNLDNNCNGEVDEGCCGMRSGLCIDECVEGMICDSACEACISPCTQEGNECVDNCGMGESCNDGCERCVPVVVSDCAPNEEGLCVDACPTGSVCNAACDGCIQLECSLDADGLCVDNCGLEMRCHAECTHCVQDVCSLDADGLCVDNCGEGTVCNAACEACIVEELDPCEDPGVPNPHCSINHRSPVAWWLLLGLPLLIRRQRSR